MERSTTLSRAAAVIAMALAGLATLASVRPMLHILHGPAAAGPPAWPARDVAFDIGLVVLFGLQHSLQARPAWKRWHLARFPGHLERITYVLASCVVWAMVVILWRSVPGTVWRLDGAAGLAVQALGIAGWALAVWSVLAMSAGDISGLSALRAILTGKSFAPPRFRAPGPYRVVRHPIMTGLIVGFWAVPVPSADRALFAALMTAYILVGVLFEERDLEGELGPAYARYRQQVPMLVPRPGRVWRAEEAA
jgi:protein-S-isoprenylcysteine O-methyltransferase Ste14